MTIHGNPIRQSVGGAILERLHHHSIISVRYFEIPYESNEPEWFTPTADSLDFGLDLILDSGQTIGITWHIRTDQGLMVLAQSVTTQVNDVRCWDVTTKSRWINFLGVPLQSTYIYWMLDLVPGETSEPAPVCIQLTFADQRVIYICYGELDLDHPPLLTTTDHVTII